MAHRSADSLVTALMLDMWPQGPAVYVDYGLNEDNYRQFQMAVKGVGQFRNREVTADQLHAACGSGKKLSALIGHPVKLQIDWDELLGV